MLTLREMEERITELSDEDFVICQLACEIRDSGYPGFAERIARREVDRDPIVRFRLFFSRVWPQPEPCPALWDEAIARMGLC